MEPDTLEKIIIGIPIILGSAGIIATAIYGLYKTDHPTSDQAQPDKYYDKIYNLINRNYS